MNLISDEKTNMKNLTFQFFKIKMFCIIFIVLHVFFPAVVPLEMMDPTTWQKTFGPLKVVLRVSVCVSMKMCISCV